MKPIFYAISLALLFTLSACTGSDVVRDAIPPGLATDPFADLPKAAAPLNAVIPYQFRDLGLARVQAAASQRDQSPVARLITARALIDALLYGELAQNGNMLDVLTGPDIDLWVRLDALLAAPPPGTDSEIEAALADGRALAAVLKGRAMDADYHALLRRLAEPENPWAIEAILARLLDLDDAIEAVATLPPETRVEAMIGALGGGVCDDPKGLPTPGDEGWDEALNKACTPVCANGLGVIEGQPASSHGALTAAACGYGWMRWSTSVDESLWTPEMGVMARMLGDAVPTLDGILRGRHPLILAMEPELMALRGRLLGRPLMVPLDFQDGPSAAPGLLMPEGSGEADPFLGTGIAVVLTRDALRLALSPRLASGADGAMHFLEGGFGFPGRAVLNPAWLVDAAPEEVRELSRRFEVEAARAFDLSAQLGGPREGREVAMMVASDVPAAEAFAALNLVRRVLAGGRLEARLAVWSKAGWAGRRVLLVESRREGELSGVPQEFRPLELRVVVRPKSVQIEAYGKQVSDVKDAAGGVDRAGIEAVLSGLRKKEGSGRQAVVAVDVAAGDVGRVVQVFDAIAGPLPEGPGFDDLVLETGR